LYYLTYSQQIQQNGEKHRKAFFAKNQPRAQPVFAAQSFVDESEYITVYANGDFEYVTLSGKQVHKTYVFLQLICDLV